MDPTKESPKRNYKYYISIFNFTKYNFFFREINNFFLLPAPVVSTTLSTFSAFTQDGVEFSLVATAAPFSPKHEKNFHEKIQKMLKVKNDEGIHLPNVIIMV